MRPEQPVTASVGHELNETPPDAKRSSLAGSASHTSRASAAASALVAAACVGLTAGWRLIRPFAPTPCWIWRDVAGRDAPGSGGWRRCRAGDAQAFPLDRFSGTQDRIGSPRCRASHVAPGPDRRLGRRSGGRQPGPPCPHLSFVVRPGAVAPNDSSTAVVVKRICSTSIPTSGARLSPGGQQQQRAIASAGQIPRAADAHTDQRGQRVGAGRRGVAVRRAARKIAVTAGPAAGEAKPLWRCLPRLQPHGDLAPRRSASSRLGSKGRNHGRVGRQRDQALLAAPILECPPVRRVEPLRLGTGVSVAPH